MSAPASLKTYDLRGVVVRALDLVDGVFIDPVLPEGFDDTDNRQRPYEHSVWWGVPFVVSRRPDPAAPEFVKDFPEGVSYDLRCLDGGAWDRSTWWGTYPSVLAAVEAAKVKRGYLVFPVHVIE